jgi:hypothetical protein
MLLRLFHKNYYTQISLLVVFAAVFAVPDFIQKTGANWSDNTLFLRLSGLHSWLRITWVYESLQLLVLVGLAFFIKYILTAHQLIHHSNFLPGLILISLFGFHQLFDFQLLSSINLFLLILAYSHLLKSYDDEKPDNALFSASFFIGLATFISYNNIVFLLLVWISFFVFQNYSWRYLPITIAAVIVPYFFFATWLFWFDQLPLLETEWLAISNYSYQLPQLNNLFLIITYSILGFFIFLSLSKIVPETSSKIISIRKKVGLSLWFLTISIVVLLFSGEPIVKNAYLIPLSGLLGYYLRSVKTRRKLIDAVFSLFIFFLLFQKYYLAYAPSLLNP